MGHIDKPGIIWNTQSGPQVQPLPGEFQLGAVCTGGVQVHDTNKLVVGGIVGNVPDSHEGKGLVVQPIVLE